MDEPGNMSLLDWQPDGWMDISDVASLVGYLFLNRAPHWASQGGGCIPIVGCPPDPACP